MTEIELLKWLINYQLGFAVAAIAIWVRIEIKLSHVMTKIDGKRKR